MEIKTKYNIGDKVVVIYDSFIVAGIVKVISITVYDTYTTYFYQIGSETFSVARREVEVFANVREAVIYAQEKMGEDFESLKMTI